MKSDAKTRALRADKTYLALLSLGAGLLTLAVGLTNFIVNPLGVYAAPVIRGFNDFHPATTAYERLCKAEAVKRLKPDVIITGTSRADSGLDPRPEFFPGLTAYNYGLSASSIYEQRQVLEYAQRVHPLKKVIVTLDLLSFNAKHLENRAFDAEQLSAAALRQPTAFFNTYGTLLSLDMLIASVKHLQALKHPERHGFILANGRKDDTDIAFEIAAKGIHQRFFPTDDAGAEADNDVHPAFNDFSFDYSARPGDTTFQHVEAMMDFARQNGIELILLISPTHEALPDPHAAPDTDAAAREKRVQDWKNRLAALDRANGRRYNAAPFPLWDFDYANSLTTEPIPPAGPGKDMKWFWDAGHYRAGLGDIVLRRVLGLPQGGPPDFGRRLV